MRALGRWLAILVVMLWTASPAMAAMTIREYIAGQAGQRDGSDLSNTIYVWGVMDGLGAFDDAIRGHLGQTLFCVDEADGRVTVDAMIKEIDREIEFARKRVIDFEAYAERTTVGDVGLKVLSALYSCETRS